MKILLLFILNFFNLVFASELAAFDGGCGIGEKNEGYKFEHAGYEYLMPKQGILLRSGEEIFRDESVYDWLTNYNGLEVARTKEFLVVRVWDTDCVDLNSFQIIMLSKNGDYYLHQHEWISNWKAGFYIENNRLNYWSEWFCYEAKQNETPNDPYIYVLDPTLKRFVKTTVPYGDYCSAIYKSEFKDIALQYETVPPIE